MPAFYALLPVRDESDIIKECLENLLGWADSIFVFDTGSVDNTWEIVNELSLNEARIKPIKKDSVYFSDTLVRGWLFENTRSIMRNSDWFIRADADEFYHVPPPEFVKSSLRKHETVVWHQQYNFCLLQKEADSLQNNEAVSDERQKPISDRRRWWWAGEYSEPRLCQYRSTMKWPAQLSFPYNAGFVAKERLPIRHYPHRDPLQLRRRCCLRSIMLEDKSISGKHWANIDQHYWNFSDWRKFVRPDNQSGLHYWKTGETLPKIKNRNHLPPFRKRFIQYILHRFFVRLVDRLRPGWQPSDYPDPIPQEIVKRLEEVLA